MVFSGVVKINSIDVTAKLQPFSIDFSKDNAISQVKLTFQVSLKNIVSLQQLQTLEIWRGEVTPTDEKIFSGFVTSIKTDGFSYSIIAQDKLFQAVNTLINQIYDLTSPQGGIISEIFKDIINTFLGLTANSTSVVDSTPYQASLLQKFKARRSSGYELLKKLADTMGWQFYYRPDTDLVYFEPIGYALNANVLNLGSEIINLPIWNENTSEFANDIIAAGEPIEVTFIDTFVGDGSTTIFTLTKGKPTTVQVKVDGTIKNGGLTTVTSNAQYTVDAEAKTITFTTGNIPTGGQAIEIVYAYRSTLVMHIPDNTSIATYGKTVSKPITFRDTLTIQDLELKARALLEKIKNPFLSTTLLIKATRITSLNLHVGQRIQVIDNRNVISGNQTVDREFVILKKSIRFPTDYDSIDVGDKEWKMADWEAEIENRIHKLYEEAIQDEDIIIEAVDLRRTLTLKRSMIEITRYYLNDSFILDHSINSIIYNPDQTAKIDDFENAATWAAESGSVTLTETNDTTSTHYWVGSQGLNYSYVASVGSGIISTSTLSSNLTGVTGVSTGTPSQGRAGVWVYVGNGSITGVSLKVGNSTTNSITCTGSTYAQAAIGNESIFSAPSGKRTYVLFDLKNPTTVTGTPTWSNISYSSFSWAIASAGNLTLDYYTASKHPLIALNGLDQRLTLRETITVIY